MTLDDPKCRTTSPHRYWVTLATKRLEEVKSWCHDDRMKQNVSWRFVPASWAAELQLQAFCRRDSTAVTSPWRTIWLGCQFNFAKDDSDSSGTMLEMIEKRLVFHFFSVFLSWGKKKQTSNISDEKQRHLHRKWVPISCRACSYSLCHFFFYDF